MKIQTSFDYLPLSVRTFDWSAIDADTYDADADQDGFFSTSPVGYGVTEQEAIGDLLVQISHRDVEAKIVAKLPKRRASNASFIGAVQ